ncbi:hypothetical protein BC828DRAFT_384415 [Blastocladiella britannica]|nr:hypothetical protein BC828DRAFT_384415 [Blastocladiella britannica]
MTVYYDNDFVRVLTVHSASQLDQLIAEHHDTKHIIVQASCAGCPACSVLDSDLATLSLKYPGDSLFLRINLARFPEAAAILEINVAAVDPPPPLVAILKRGSDLCLHLSGPSHSLAGGAEVANPSDNEDDHAPIVDGAAVEEVLLKTLEAIPFDQWVGKDEPIVQSDVHKVEEADTETDMLAEDICECCRTANATAAETDDHNHHQEDNEEDDDDDESDFNLDEQVALLHRIRAGEPLPSKGGSVFASISELLFSHGVEVATFAVVGVALAVGLVQVPISVQVQWEK